jgi:hypothetical protein
MDDSHPLVRELESGLADAAAALNSADLSESGALGTPVSLIQGARISTTMQLRTTARVNAV